MKKEIITLITALFILLPSLTAQVPVPAPPQSEGIVLSGGTVHTGDGRVIENAAVAFDNGVIVAVGSAAEVTSAHSSFRRVDVTGKHIYPGLIMPGTNLGLAEIGGHGVATDHTEMGRYNPGVRAIVAYNTDSHVPPVIRSAGVLLAQITPNSGVIPGLSSVVQLDAWTWDQAAYKKDGGMQVNWPSTAQAGGGGRSAYDRTVEELETLFDDARAYLSDTSPNRRRNLNLEPFEGLFDGSRILYINASDARGIMASILFFKRQGVQRIVLLNATEEAWLVRDFLKEHDIPVIAGHVHSMPRFDHSDTRMTYRLPALFMKEGILTGLTHSSTTYGFNLPFVAGQAVGYGLTPEEALQLITLNNAKILGIDDRTGSIEVGKDANLLVSGGDILDLISHDIETAFIQGREIDLDNKFRQLRDKFNQKFEQR